MVGRQIWHASERNDFLQFRPSSPLVVSPLATLSIAISPFQARAAPQMLQNYLFNGYRRLASQAPYFAIPFAVGTRAHSPIHPHTSYLRLQATASTAGPTVVTHGKTAKRGISHQENTIDLCPRWEMGTTVRFASQSELEALDVMRNKLSRQQQRMRNLRLFGHTPVQPTQ